MGKGKASENNNSKVPLIGDMWVPRRVAMILFKDNSKSLVLDFGDQIGLSPNSRKTSHHPPDHLALARGAVALVGVEQLVARSESEFHIIFVRKFCHFTQNPSWNWTPPRKWTNMSPEKRPFQKERILFQLPTIIFCGGLCSFFLGFGGLYIRIDTASCSAKWSCARRATTVMVLCAPRSFR